MVDLCQAWRDAVAALGGSGERAARHCESLVAAYSAAERSYHDISHVEQVINDVAGLAAGFEVGRTELAAAIAAACAHDVIYAGEHGADEEASAVWAHTALAASGVPMVWCERVAGMIRATADHVADPDDLAGWLLLDADLAVLGSDGEGYRRYVAAVRQEYAWVSDPDWIIGRSAVLRGLLNRGSIYHLEVARQRWEAMAQHNIADELASLEATPTS